MTTTEIVLDESDTPDERARKVWGAIGFTSRRWPEPLAKLSEALKAYRDMDREAMAKEMTPLIMEARAEAVEAKAEWVRARAVAARGGEGGGP